MANECYVNMMVKGTKDNIAEFIKRLDANYNYTNNVFDHKPHFWGVYHIVDEHEEKFDEKTDLAIHNIYLYCKWSIYSSLLGHDHSYYADGKKREESGQPNYGTCLEESTKELDLDVELISEEAGMGFMEHIRVTKGDITIDEIYNNYIEVIIDHYKTFDEFKEDIPAASLTKEEFNKLIAEGEQIYKENAYEGGFVMMSEE